MALPEVRVVSIGALAAHPLWEESQPVRTGHATTTLIDVDDIHILVNPGLPAQALMARMGERSPVQASEITHIFLTTFNVEHYRAVPAFNRAIWLIHEPERLAARAALEPQLERSRENGDMEAAGIVQEHLDLLERCQDAADVIAPGVDLFPLPGISPGTCGLLLPLPTRTVLIAGDAVATKEHLEQAKILPTAIDVETAQESFREVIEIADEIVPGRDNVVLNPTRAGM